MCLLMDRKRSRTRSSSRQCLYSGEVIDTPGWIKKSTAGTPPRARMQAAPPPPQAVQAAGELAPCRREPACRPRRRRLREPRERAGARVAATGTAGNGRREPCRPPASSRPAAGTAGQGRREPACRPRRRHLREPHERAGARAAARPPPRAPQGMRPAAIAPPRA